MTPILLIAFLALGPALADQLSQWSPVVSPVRIAVAQGTGANAPTALGAEHTWLCGR